MVTCEVNQVNDDAGQIIPLYSGHPLPAMADVARSKLNGSNIFAVCHRPRPG